MKFYFFLRTGFSTFPERASQIPPVPELFKLIAGMDDTGGDPNANGTDSIGAVKWAKRKGFIKSYFNFDTTDQMKAFIRDYAPIGAGFILPTQIAIDQVTDPERGMTRGRVTEISGDAGPRHAVIFYGYDDEFPCALALGWRRLVRRRRIFAVLQPSIKKICLVIE